MLTFKQIQHVGHRREHLVFIGRHCKHQSGCLVRIAEYIGYIRIGYIVDGIGNLFRFNSFDDGIESLFGISIHGTPNNTDFFFACAAGVVTCKPFVKGRNTIGMGTPNKTVTRRNTFDIQRCKFVQSL